MVKSVTILAALQAVAFHSQCSMGDLFLQTRQASGCLPSASGQYEVNIIKPTALSKRDLERRAQCGVNSSTVTLNNGELADTEGRVAGRNRTNQQFIFEDPQTSINDFEIDLGWVACPNGTLILGTDPNLWECGPEGVLDLFFEPVDVDCVAINLELSPCTETSSTTPTSTTSSLSSSTSSISSSTSSSSSSSSSSSFSSSSPASTTSSSSPLSPSPTLSSSAANITSEVSSATSPTLTATTSATQSLTAAASSSPVDSGISYSTRVSLGISVGIGGALLLSALLIWWLILRKMIATQKSSVSEVKLESSISVDQEPGVAVSETEHAGIFIL